MDEIIRRCDAVTAACAALREAERAVDSAAAEEERLHVIHRDAVVARSTARTARNDASEALEKALERRAPRQ